MAFTDPGGAAGEGFPGGKTCFILCLDTELLSLFLPMQHFFPPPINLAAILFSGRKKYVYPNPLPPESGRPRPLFLCAVRAGAARAARHCPRPRRKSLAAFSNDPVLNNVCPCRDGCPRRLNVFPANFKIFSGDKPKRGWMKSQAQ